MGFQIEKEFMVVSVKEDETKNGRKKLVLSLLDWDNGTTTQFEDWDLKYGDLKPKQNVKALIKVGTKRNKNTGFSEWGVYLNGVTPVES